MLKYMGKITFGKFMLTILMSSELATKREKGKQ